MTTFSIVGDDISDGSHTFGELYEHRYGLFVALCRELADRNKFVWRSRKHSDGGGYEGYFLLGIASQPGRQISYHLPDRLWDETAFAATLAAGPTWDGHTAQDVLERLKKV